MGRFPELLIDDSCDLYVRRGCNEGFSEAECRDINAMRAGMRNGEHITSEDALRLAREVLTYFGVTP